MTSIRESLDRQVYDLDGFDGVSKIHAEQDPKTHLGTFWRAAPIVGQAADVASTVIVLHRLDGKAVEGNKLMRPFTTHGVAGEVAFVGLKLGVGAAIAYGGARLAHAGHAGSAKVLTGIAGAMGVGAAAHNVSVLRQQR
jgi:hypothetical protein